MRVVVIGGNGLIGSRVVRILTERGHEAVAASPRTGVDATTGRGLADALANADVVVDVANSPSFEDAAVLAFFESSGRNLARVERATGVRHHVAVSIVGCDRLPESGYLRAKVAQEHHIKESGVPYTIIRATQFFEFLDAIAAAGTSGNQVRLSTGGFQPIAADDVALAVANAALEAPVNATIEIGGPECMAMSDFVGRYLKTLDDPRAVVGDPDALYFGTRLGERSLVPECGARLGTTRLDEWMRRRAASPARTKGAAS